MRGFWEVLNFLWEILCTKFRIMQSMPYVLFFFLSFRNLWLMKKCSIFFRHVNKPTTHFHKRNYDVIRPSALFDNSYKIRKSFSHTAYFGFYNYFRNLLPKVEEMHAVNNKLLREMSIDTGRVDFENRPLDMNESFLTVITSTKN